MYRQVQRASWRLGRGRDFWKGSGEQRKSGSLGTLPENFLAVVGDRGCWDRAVGGLKWWHLSWASHVEIKRKSVSRLRGRSCRGLEMGKALMGSRSCIWRLVSQKEMTALSCPPYMMGCWSSTFLLWMYKILHLKWGRFPSSTHVNWPTPAYTSPSPTLTRQSYLVSSFPSREDLIKLRLRSLGIGSRRLGTPVLNPALPLIFAATSVSILQVRSSIHRFSRFCTYMLINGTCFSDFTLYDIL